MASVRKRTWTDGEGKTRETWVVEYTDGMGKRRRETPPSGLKKDAETIKRRIEREQTDGTQIARSQTITVAQLTELYREHAEAKRLDGRISVARTSQLYFHFRAINKYLGKILLTELTAQDVESYYNGQLANERMQPISAKNRVHTLKMMQDFAIKRKLMAKRPVDEAMKDLRGLVQKPIRVFTKDEIITLLQTAGQRGYKRRPSTTSMTNCLVNLAVFCGLRYGEIIGLTVPHLDLDKRVIRVRTSFEKHTETLKGPKTKAGIRDVPMPPHVVAILREWMDQFYQENPLNLVFTTTEGKWLQQSNFRNNNWLPLLKRAGFEYEVDPFHFHSLRHFCASWMIENGIGLTEVARLLGHSKFDMTLQVYAHPVHSPTYAREAMDSSAQLLITAPRTIEVMEVRDTLPSWMRQECAIG